MKKLITILTALIVIIAFSAGSLLALATPTVSGSIKFTNYPFGLKDTLKTSVTISKCEDTRHFDYYVGSEIWNDGGRIVEGDDAMSAPKSFYTSPFWKRSYTRTAKAAYATKGYGAWFVQIVDGSFYADADWDS